MSSREFVDEKGLWKVAGVRFWKFVDNRFQTFQLNFFLKELYRSAGVRQLKRALQC